MNRRTPRPVARWAFFLLTLLSAIAPGTLPAFAEEAAETPRVADFAWLEGRWVGDHGGAVIEEHWSGVDGGTMMGMFRVVSAGESGANRIGLYEFWALEPGDGGPELRMRHFSPGLRAWEEKEAPLVFRVVAVGRRAVSFETQEESGAVRLSYSRPEEGVLVAELYEAGKVSRFEYRLAD